MKLRYVVHSCSQEPIQVEAQFNGQTIEASVQGIVAELVSEDGKTSQTLRYIPEDFAADLALFAEGSTVTATYSADQP